MYAIRSYYDIEEAYGPDSHLRLLKRLGDRITSYNVCYTKLLRGPMLACLRREEQVDDELYARARRAALGVPRIVYLRIMYAIRSYYVTVGLLNAMYSYLGVHNLRL